MDADERARVVLTPIASPLPLTFVGLLLGSTVVSGAELGWIPHDQLRQTGWVLLAIPIPLQILAAVMGFHGRSASAATGSSAIGAAWLSIALDLINAPPGAQSPSRAVALLAFAVAASLLVPAASDARGGSRLPAFVLGCAATRFLLVGLSGFSGSNGLRHASGIVGCVVAAVALYAALALELEGVTQDPALPTFRHEDSAAALDAPLTRQVDRLEHEAGVRKSL